MANLSLALTVAGDFAPAEAVLTEARDGSRARRQSFWEGIALARLVSTSVTSALNSSIIASVTSLPFSFASAFCSTCT